MSQLGKVALVTGGAQGIGRAFVESLLAEGASVAICDINKTKGEEAAKTLSQKYPKKVIYLECDVTNEQQFEGCFKSTIKRFSKIDIVINNAGVANERDPAWKSIIAVNFTGVVSGSKLAMKYMGRDQEGKGGTLVNIGSVTILDPWALYPVYSATKAAVNQFSRSIGENVYYKKTGVRVLTINPGLTDTELVNKKPCDDEDVFNDAKGQLGNCILQSTDYLGKGLLEVLDKGGSGSSWTIENCKPPHLTQPKPWN